MNKANRSSEVLHVSLQGSLEAFPLPDVLGLLAVAKKDGELRVQGRHVDGRVWVHEGAVVGAEAAESRSLVDALFQLLRVEQGTFTFDPGAAVPDGKPSPLEPLLAEAQARLAEWQTIAAVVPSLAARVRLADHLPGPRATVTAAQWRVLRTVGGGCAVGAVAEALGENEFGACQAVKRLVDAGLVVVEGGAERVEPAGEPEPDQVEEPAPERTAPDLDTLVSIPANLRRRPRPPVVEPPPRRSKLAEAAARRLELEQGAEAAPEADPETSDGAVSETASEASADETSGLLPAAAAALSAENADALVRELAQLGGDQAEAAEAVEAAVRAGTTEERVAALEGVLTNEQGEPLNRALLMKFLSSVRS